MALVLQRSYDPEGLRAALAAAIQAAGFDLKRVAGRRVLLKPNMLGAYPPHMGVTTHPAFVEAIARIFIAAGAAVAIGDSPNGVYPIDKVWEATGMRAVCRATGAEEVHFEAAGSAERGGISISRAALDAEILVNLPKFKSHGLTVMTLAAKNLFGCVSGMQKTAHHRRCRTREEFAETIARIADEVKPALSIVDGIVAMDGNGPSAGNLVELGVVAAGTDVHAVDSVCCQIVNLAPLELDTLAAAKRLALWGEACPIEVVGTSIPEARPKNFRLPSTYTKGLRDWWISRFVIGRIWRGLSARPVIAPKLCQRCLMCMEACPFGAITRDGGPSAPEIDPNICEECMCCHETCPHRAIGIKESRLLKVARWLSERRARK